MFRFLCRKTILLLFIIAAVVLVKHSAAGMLQTIGDWITGVENQRVVQVFSDLTQNIANNGAMKDAVEVFREALQD